MLNASQKRTNRAPFTEALMSSTPARNAGLIRHDPDGPAIRAARNPITIFFAKCSCTSKK